MALPGWEGTAPLGGTHLVTVVSGPVVGQQDFGFGNLPPVALGDGFALDEDMTLTIVGPGVLGNDADADLGEFARGFIPTLPHSDPDGVQWTIALSGGIGGTVTMLAYGYWMREEAASEPGNQPSLHRLSHRVDLAIAYTVTAVFGIALTVLSADVPVHSSGSNLFHAIASRLDVTINPIAGWAYLAGAWCAVSACMLGVWQFTPLLFTDLISIDRTGPSNAASANPAENKTPDARSPAYKAYLIGLATIPALGIWFDFADVQRAFGIISALFVPLLAAALLLMNNRRAWVGKHSNGWFTNAALIAALAVAVLYLANEVSKLLAN